MAYKKGDPEYRSNGHYVIDGVDWMSIWTYKNKMGLGNNNKDANGSESRELLSNGKQSHDSVPDFGSYGKILIFKETDLNAHYD